MANDIHCLGCSAAFGSCRQLAAHASQRALNSSLTDQLFTCKCKSDKKKHKDKWARRDHSPVHIPEDVVIPDQPKIQDLMSFDQDNNFIHNDIEMGRAPSPSPPPIVSQRSGHRICMPARFTDFLPGSATHLAHMLPTARQQRGHDVIADQHTDQHAPRTPSPQQSLEDEETIFVPFETEPNEAGLYRIYPTRPSILPIDNTLATVTNAPTLAGGDKIPDSSRITEGLSSKEIGQEDLLAAFSNPTSDLLMAYQYSGTGHQSVAELQRLTGFIGDPLFNNIDAASFSHTRESKNINAYLEKSNPFWEEYGWRHSAIKIRLPKAGMKWNTETEAPELKISGVHHQLITDIIESIFQDDIARTYNMMPYREYWKSPDGCDVEIFSEAYSSAEMIETYQEINDLPHEPGDDLERTVASLMFWSDATHLANFGDASLWPFYLYFGNQSKYTWGKPTASACHHVTYIPSLGTPVDGMRVKAILNDESLVPTCNAFLAKLLPHGFNWFHMFVVNKLHEFELGVWKAEFTHLMCILHAAGGDAVQKLNERYRAMPTFGRETIRKFHTNALAMKRLAARDFEDLLHCVLPIFEGLLPDDDNKMVLDLLFDLATWHGFTKLHMHTEDTLNFFDTATTILGQTVCKFVRTTYPKVKKLNLKTYNFSTQPGELQHRCVKRWYPKTPKGKKNTVSSMTRIETWERLMGKIVKTQATLASREGNTGSQRCQRERTSPANHFHISKYAKSSMDLTEWLSELPEDDLAVVDFIPKLKDHLLTCLRGIEYTGDELNFTDEERAQILIANNKIYDHSVLRINYTTYDLCREKDSLNPRTRADVMVLSHEDDDNRHPYWYTWIIRIFHVDVWDRNDGAMEKPCQMEFLFVRWFGRNAKFLSGWSAKCLPRIGFLTGKDPNAFGFLDPDSDGARMMNEEEEEDEVGDDNKEEEEEDEEEDEDNNNNNNEEDPDRIEADEGEELDDDILAAEGYGAL
ncbi:hypothetical protein CY34DRAFT_18247 [Suillus luteus UH-Slu-Lm8-n1]|uniref:Unplaced genomic scaffold CY34scaffold_768, whole genome shotgun sequence n=1 Tax=Suillus luteus UH-Slu-Lm8-n1 TaxID=930992 RepID=A0A0D0AH93_9AGAM|nr:hypothetical protein CY34DRAFT_18247 [Suillus luteus UH-Slu-Lm8-n1]